MLVGLALSLLIERLLQPGVHPLRQRRPAALILHCGLYLLVFAFELALFRRPWFAAVMVLALPAVLVLVNNAKYRALREPFIYQDFEYFVDTLRHPRLYLPFFGLGKALSAFAGFVLVLLVGMELEAPLTAAMPAVTVFAGIGALVVSGLVLLAVGAAQKLPVTFDPADDISSLGLLASLWRYAEEERKRPSVHSPFTRLRTGPAPTVPCPHLVVVQSESFFDPRPFFDGIRPEVLKNIDALNAASLCHGKLGVPAWGANTVRTEFAFLSGLAEEQLGVHRFNPYRQLARAGIPTLASVLKDQGYRTVCVHPYPAGFYCRDQVFPLLGFDTFIDIRSFTEARKSGPYVGDIALAEKVCSLLGDTAAQPIFVFVITMENHGPLHWEKAGPDDAARLYASPPPEGCEDLTIYLRHLRNADRMAGMLRDRLAAMSHPARLCWFGDHVPIMPRVYETLGLPDGRTDYFIWGNDRTAGNGKQQDIKVEDLGRLLLTGMGLIREETGGGTSGKPFSGRLVPEPQIF
jgi:hypothetical protein